MANFVEAFQDGLRAVEAANRAKHEVKEVFDELNKQLNMETNGKLRVILSQFEMPDLGLGWSQLGHYFATKPKQYYWAIAAFNPDAGEASMKELAQWSQDRAGYPCKITSGGTESICEDRIALEEGLAELLRDPLVAETLVKVMKRERVEKAEEKPEDNKE